MSATASEIAAMTPAPAYFITDTAGDVRVSHLADFDADVERLRQGDFNSDAFVGAALRAFRHLALTAESRLEAVKALHARTLTGSCAECGRLGAFGAAIYWPCPTFRAASDLPEGDTT